MDGQMQQSQNKFEISNKVFWLAAILIAGAVVYFLGGLYMQMQNLPQNAPQTISISGEGKAYAKPDIAIVDFGVNTQGQKSQDVLDKNNKTMNDIISAIKGQGVDEKDIQTSGYNLSPLYSYSRDGQRVFNGYSLDQQITVKIRNFDKIGDILAAAGESGANTIGSLQFTIENPETVRADARAKAIAQAKDKAQTMVNQAGLHIVKLENISEGYGSVPAPVYGMGMANSMKDISSVVAPSIQSGQMEIDITVNLTYQVK